MHLNRLARIRADDAAAPPQPLLTRSRRSTAITSSGDLVFGGDQALRRYRRVHEARQAGDAASMRGKILRLNPDGSTPSDGPFGPEHPAYSMGHRNSFGLCVDPSTGDLWETENGPGSDDEVNRIEPAGNYGWPDQLGPGGEPKFIDPVLDFPDVIVPTGCAVWEGDLYFGAYGTGALYRLSLPAGSDARADVVGDAGAGITDLQVGPDGDLYVATSEAIWKLSRTGSPTPQTNAPAADPSGGWKTAIPSWRAWRSPRDSSCGSSPDGACG
jgi:quinoprotein glucose dehydrogenase